MTITDSKGTVILKWAPTTGTAPCGMQVRNDGSVAIVDANNLVVYVNGARHVASCMGM